MLKRGDEVLAGRLVPAFSLWDRVRGLIGRPCPAPGECWVLCPASGVHTAFMRYSIAACLLDRSGRVLWVRDPMPPWRLALYVRGAHLLLEMAPGSFSQVSRGDVLSLEL